MENNDLVKTKISGLLGPYLGKEINCIYYQNGELNGYATTLQSMSDYNIIIGDSGNIYSLPFWSSDIAILAIFDGESKKLIYKNSLVEEYYRNKKTEKSSASDVVESKEQSIEATPTNDTMESKEQSLDATPTNDTMESEDISIETSFNILETLRGTKVTCKYWEQGEVHEISGVLDNFIPYDLVCIDGNMITFAGPRKAIEEIRNSNNNLVYKNSKVKGFKVILPTDVFAVINYKKEILGEIPDVSQKL